MARLSNRKENHRFTGRIIALLAISSTTLLSFTLGASASADSGVVSSAIASSNVYKVSNLKEPLK